jgi:hypothetical protein
MEHNAWIGSAGQEIPRLLWKRKAHYRVERSPPLACVLMSGMNPIHAFTHCFSVVNFNIVLPFAPTSAGHSFSRFQVCRPQFLTLSYVHNACYISDSFILLDFVLIVFTEDKTFQTFRVYFKLPESEDPFYRLGGQTGLSFPSSANCWTGMTVGGLYFEIMKSCRDMNSPVVQQIDVVAQQAALYRNCANVRRRVLCQSLSLIAQKRKSKQLECPMEPREVTALKLRVLSLLEYV